MTLESRRLWLILGAVACVSIGGATFAQVRRAERAAPVQLLPGYKHEPQQGIDTLVGRISRPDGPAIVYEIGPARADIKTSPGRLKWAKELAMPGGRRVRVFMVEGDHLLVDPGLVTFTASNVRTTEDVAEVLMMALSFDGDAFLRR